VAPLGAVGGDRVAVLEMPGLQVLLAEAGVLAVVELHLDGAFVWVGVGGGAALAVEDPGPRLLRAR
jgi:hypothetical protein